MSLLFHVRLEVFMPKLGDPFNCFNILALHIESREDMRRLH